MGTRLRGFLCTLGRFVLCRVLFRHEWVVDDLQPMNSLPGEISVHCKHCFKHGEQYDRRAVL
jgi:hypothetical protein